MPGLIKDVKKAVIDYKSELSALKKKTLTINKSVCDLDDVISSIQASTQTQEQKIASLDTFQRNCEDFIADVVRIDSEVADVIRQRKDCFYDTYHYLKPECEKNGWEKFKDGCKSVGEWCKEHWKLIGTILIVIAAIAVIVFFPAAAPILLLAAKGAILGAVTGGLLGGLTSLASGDSFWEGFENGAFSGAVTGALFGGLGGVGQMFGKAFGVSCKVFSAIKYTSMISGGLSLGMAGFDLLSFGAGLIFGRDNPLTSFNSKLHSSKGYNAFQFGISALAVFSGSAYQTMKPMHKTCFIAGTMILTATGLVAIENIKTGDKVISTDVETFETSEKCVLEAFSLDCDTLVHIWINQQKTSVTPNHPYWVVGSGWVNAGELVAGNKLRTANGDIVCVQKIENELLSAPVKVYNFKVEDYHTYYAGDACVLVHNADCVISRSKHPDAAKHIEDAIDDGHPSKLTIDRTGAKANRQASLKGIDKVPGKQLDEFPPAMFKEGGKGASVRPINPHDNMGAGSSMGHQLRQYPDGTEVNFIITD